MLNMSKVKTPAIFIGHGSPMSAMENNAYGLKWKAFGKTLEKPKAILVISAHWNINEAAISDVKNPKQIYDFYGFPDELYALKYEPIGSSELALQVKKALDPIVDVKINNEWGIDHGAWIPLTSIFPKADIPVVELSLNYKKSSQFHYELGKLLRPLREQGVMIIGSGDIVHNLGEIDWEQDAEPFSWAKKFEQDVLELIKKREHESLINFSKSMPEAEFAVPTPEHFLPLLCILGLQEDDDELEYFVEGIAHGSISMTSFVLK